jgi:hypothetical protein
MDLAFLVAYEDEILRLSPHLRMTLRHGLFGELRRRII